MAFQANEKIFEVSC